MGAGQLGEDANQLAGNPFSVNQFSNEPVGRFGDLLPLPVPEDIGFPGEIGELRSRRSQQRVGARRMRLRREAETVQALNELGGFSDERQWPAFCRNQAQSASLARIRRAHQNRAPAPESMTPQAALRQLLQKAGSSYGEGQPGQVVSYIRDRLSLPRDQAEPVMLEELLPRKELQMLIDFREHMMLSSEELAGVLEKGLENDKYFDPLLDSCPRKYHELIADMYGAKLLGFTTQPKVQVGLFCVSKKAGKQRLIVDARRANKIFKKPPSTVLGSVEAWGRLECEEDELFIAQEDVKDFFYRLQIPKDLGEFFAFPPIDACMLKDVLGYVPDEVRDLAGSEEAPIFPHMRVLPMGFSWAFHLAHEAHKTLACRTLPSASLLEDRRAAPVMSKARTNSAMLIYADNNNHLGVTRDRVESDQGRVLEALHEHGLDTHDHVYCTSLAESLAVRIDGLGGTVGPTAARDWRLDKALEACLWRPRLSGSELQVLVGHMTVRALINRGLMGLLRHCYVFIEECYDRRTRLWPSVVAELRWFRALMPLAVANIFSKWSGTVFATDACLTGYAVCAANMDAEEVRGVGQEDERWRFYRGEGEKLAPRAAALDTSAVFKDPVTVRPESTDAPQGSVNINPKFPEVPKEFLEGGRWRMLWNAPFSYKDPIHILECRSVLSTVKHVCRDSNLHGKRCLILNDNMGVVLALAKGRCSSYPSGCCAE